MMLTEEHETASIQPSMLLMVIFTFGLSSLDGFNVNVNSTSDSSL